MLAVYLSNIVLIQAQDFKWAKKIIDKKTTGCAYVKRITIDKEDNIILAGGFIKDVVFADTTYKSYGYNDICLMKYSSTGEKLFFKQFGGRQSDQVYGLFVTPNSDIYLCGSFQATAIFDTLVFYKAPHISDYTEYYDEIFIVGINKSGKLFYGEQYKTGPFRNEGHNIVIDADDNIFLTGVFRSRIKFKDSLLLEGDPLFLTKINSNRNTEWIKELTRYNDDLFVGNLLIDSQRNLLVTGRISRVADLDGVSNKINYHNVFIAKYSSKGEFMWYTNFDTDREYPINLALDSKSNSIMTTTFNNKLIVGNTMLTTTGNYNGFIVKQNQVGEVIWAKQIVSDNFNVAGNAIIDKSDNILVTGRFFGEIKIGDKSVQSNGLSDIFIAKLDANGNTLWLATIGGKNYDYDPIINYNSKGNVVLLGAYDFTTTIGNTVLNSDTSGNTFLTEFSEPLTSVPSEKTEAYRLIVQDNGDYLIDIDGESITAQMYNLLGDEVRKYTTKKISTSSLMNGVYYLKISNGQNYFLEKIIIQH
ncbi:MAG: T9SS type A sorting domain-containing protein [Chlorobiota bacterium]|jgi:hypothetical protein|nr:T9SS type A sorting domain-containing protein [Chlorobiota bacterium]QQS67203.1 MAG: T9SS type A sorting domain-containing protein [Chlorobiota bacterium]